MRSLSKATACLSTVALGLAMGCATESFSGPDPVIARDGTLSASTTVIPCPPTVPAGYTLVTCFDFDLIPGVWHGFIGHALVHDAGHVPGDPEGDRQHRRPL